MKRRAAIIGAGPVGCLAAEVLAGHGFHVDLYEKRSTLQQTSSGRTINLSLSPRGMRALDHFGAGDAVRRASVPMRARAFHPQNGELCIQPYGEQNWQTYSINRDELNRTLLARALRRPEVRIRYGWSCLHVDFSRQVLTLRDPEGALSTVAADLIVGTDGVASMVRAALLRIPRINFAKTVFPGEYHELTLKSKAGDFPFYGHAIHIWPRGDFFMVALPNQDRTLRATLVLPDTRGRQLRSAQAIAVFLEQYLPDILPHLAETPDELLRKPVGEIVTVRCEALHYRSCLLLLGDAAHAVVPFMGQGVNLGLEDCMVLAELLDEQSGDLEEAFAALTQRRLPEGLACADLSEWNLKELTSGRPVAAPSAESLVSRVNFSGQSYRAIAERTIPNWLPRVAGSFYHDAL